MVTIMKTRLQHLIDLLGTNPAQFANNIGIQRSTMSHLLSGRNKPGYDFFTKIAKIYPQVNIEWLLLGTGSPMKNGILTEPLPPEPQEELFDKGDNDPLFCSSDVEESSKRIQRITIFFSDGSFQEFFPK